MSFVETRFRDGSDQSTSVEDPPFSGHSNAPVDLQSLRISSEEYHNLATPAAKESFLEARRERSMEIMKHAYEVEKWMADEEARKDAERRCIARVREHL